MTLSDCRRLWPTLLTLLLLGGAVVSLLENGGRRTLAVVNRDFRAAMPLTVRLDGSKRVREARKDGSDAPVERAFTRRVQPGDVVVLACDR